jgi:hypothetical protein
MIAYLGHLRKLVPRLNPYFYDLEPKLVRNAFPGERIPSGPPNEACVIEEPPYICESPWLPAALRGQAQRPLLLKSPSNAYRLDFLRALFPNAEITVVHVMRNPAASVAGLMCGWLHHGFFKHRTPPDMLRIDGYSGADRPWTSRWWKFDLPPGWTQLANRPLEEVCRFQWLSANEHILRWVQRNRGGINYIQTAEQDLAHDARAEMVRLFTALNVRADDGLFRALELDRHTMISYSISEDRRAELRRIAARITDCDAVKQALEAYDEAGSGGARARAFDARDDLAAQPGTMMH